MQFNSSTVNVGSQEPLVRVANPNEVTTRRRTSPWHYFDRQISTPRPPPQFFPVSITAPNVTVICNNVTLLSATYVLDPIDFDELIPPIFWEQIAGPEAVITNGNTLTPLVTLPELQGADVVLRVYVNKGLPDEVFSDMTIFRAPIDFLRTGTFATTNKFTVFRTTVPTDNPDDPVILLLNKQLSPVDLDGNKFDTYNYNDATLAQINWRIPLQDPVGFKFKSVEVYANGVLIQKYFTIVQGLVVPIEEKKYTIFIQYLNLLTGLIESSRIGDKLNVGSFLLKFPNSRKQLLMQDLHTFGANAFSSNKSQISRVNVSVRFIEDRKFITGANAFSSNKSKVNRVNVNVRFIEDRKFITGANAFSSNRTKVNRVNGVSIG
ncbi:hypothetical protein GD1_138 [Paraglaciecola Antarctic GD virus 1]|nr:hypothetical protein GD1_138 [Paraglaciecola Antarctic GD virus 1]